MGTVIRFLLAAVHRRAMQFGILLVACLLFNTLSAKTYLVQTKDKGSRRLGSLPSGSDYSAGSPTPPIPELLSFPHRESHIPENPYNLKEDEANAEPAIEPTPPPIPELLSFPHRESNIPENTYKLKEDEANADPAIEKPVLDDYPDADPEPPSHPSKAEFNSVESVESHETHETYEAGIYEDVDNPYGTLEALTEAIEYKTTTSEPEPEPEPEAEAGEAMPPYGKK